MPSGLVPAATDGARRARIWGLVLAISLAVSPTARAGEAKLSLDAAGHYQTPVMIGAKGPYGFVVDTGAQGTTVVQRLVDELKPSPVEGAVNVRGAGGAVAAARYRFRDVHNGAFAFPELTAAIFPNSDILKADGVLGMDRFTSARVELDFAGGRLRIGASGPTPRGFAGVPATIRFGSFVFVTVTVNGVQTRAAIDTGAARTTGNLALMKALGYRPGDPRLSSTTPIRGAAGGQTAVTKGRFAALAIGRAAFGPGDIIFADVPVMKLLAAADEPFLVLGSDVLSHASAIAIDYPRSELQIRLTDA
jgi:predicted aspartyl protease